MTNLEAAKRVLREAGAPLRYDEIVARAISGGFLSCDGLTPDATMRAQISTSIVREGSQSPFVRTAPGIYGLRDWAIDGDAIESSSSVLEDVRIAGYPEYDALRALLPVLRGMPRSLVTGMRAAIWEQTGTFEENVDWTEPDKWIPERLVGEFREAALRIWTSTKHKVNPRHLRGHWNLANAYELVVDGVRGTLDVSPLGLEFVAKADSPIVRNIDEHEGLVKILSLIAERGSVSSSELLHPWMEYAQRVSGIRAESTGRSFLYYRLRNLIARNLLTRAGLKYGVAAEGLAYLQQSGFVEAGRSVPPQTSQLLELVSAQRATVRNALHDHLSEIDPYAFEYVIKQLLQEMGYTEVEVTARSGDKGVDVVARIVVGITELREVVQVKRQRSNIGRPVLDGLRGSLHRFGAVRGTLVTLGGFTKGTSEAAFEIGAAPITLIDGERLLDLLIDKGIGVRTESLKVLELDLDAFSAEVAEEARDLTGT